MTVAFGAVRPQSGGCILFRGYTMLVSILRQSSLVLVSLVLALGSRAAGQTLPAEEARSKPGKFVGTVVDALTKQPIADFNVQTSVKPRKGFQFFTTQDGYDRDPAHPGRFEVRLDASVSRFGISVVAPGYLSAETGDLRPEAGDQSFTFELQPAADLTGKVLDASGKPAAGAAIYRVQGRKYLSIKNGKLDSSGSDPQTTQANDAGGFSFPATKGYFKLVIVADTGFAEVTSDEFKVGVPILLEPWAQVSGVARSSSGPLANTVVRGRAVSQDLASHSNAESPVVDVSFEATTDGEGRFTVDRTAPGRYIVGRAVSVREGFYMMESIETRGAINVEAGKLAEISFGGGGRQLKGSIQPPVDDGQKKDASVRIVELIGKVVLPPRPTPPKPAQEMTEEEKKSFVESDEMKAYERLVRDARMSAFFSRTKVNADGSFEFDDVPLGEYTLRGDYVMGTGFSPSAETLGFVSESIRVDAGETPLELKPAPIKMRFTLLRGQPAPAFEVPSLDGKSTIKLSDYKGKIVLLDFWATWCAPCMKGLPHLKSLHERFKDDPRFVMIGMSLDQSKEKLEQVIEREQIGWMQVRLATAEESKVTASYGVEGIPMIVLLDGEGRVVMHGNYGEGLETTVERLLASLPK